MEFCDPFGYKSCEFYSTSLQCVSSFSSFFFNSILFLVNLSSRTQAYSIRLRRIPDLGDGFNTNFQWLGVENPCDSEDLCPSQLCELLAIFPIFSRVCGDIYLRGRIILRAVRSRTGGRTGRPLARRRGFTLPARDDWLHVWRGRELTPGNNQSEASSNFITMDFLHNETFIVMDFFPKFFLSPDSRWCIACWYDEVS